jgi:hypothetical protein
MPMTPLNWGQIKEVFEAAPSRSFRPDPGVSAEPMSVFSRERRVNQVVEGVSRRTP